MPSKKAREKAERVAKAKANAEVNATLARAVLGDDLLRAIARKYDGYPNTAETRALLVADVRAAMAKRTQGALRVETGRA